MAFVKEDIVRVKLDGGAGDVYLAWGDEVEVTGYASDRTQVRLRGPNGRRVSGSVKGKLPTQSKGVLQFAMVDVQQGDGLFIQTPAGRKIIVDGGDNQMLARYLAARFRGTSATSPLDIDLILVTHGDADHFAGLSLIRKSESDPALAASKRLFIRPKRYYHNGLGQGPEQHVGSDDLRKVGAHAAWQGSRGGRPI